MTLYRLDPAVFHAEHAFGRPEQARFGVQRCHNELTSQSHHLLDESLHRGGERLIGVVQQDISLTQASKDALGLLTLDERRIGSAAGSSRSRVGVV